MLIKKTHIIAVSTHYYGILIKDNINLLSEGKKKKNPALSGFLNPHSGHIKKIAVRFEIKDEEYCHDLTGSLFSFFF